MTANLKKIVWAADIFETPEQHAHAMALLVALSRPTNATIEPVYVLGTPYAQPQAEPPAEIEQAFAALAEKRLLELANLTDIKTIKPGKILTNRSGSARKDVDALLKYAESEKADGIVVATHARTGISRFFMGSFAETLAMRSKIPIFTVNPETQIREQISSILFPTTFQERFRPGFERAVELAKSLGANLTLYYKDPVVPTSHMSAKLHEVIEQENIERIKRAEQWQAWALQQGVQTESAIDNRPGHLVTELTEFASVKNFDLIAMASEAEPILSPILGSVARQVIRTAHCPVWVIRLDEPESPR